MWVINQQQHIEEETEALRAHCESGGAPQRAIVVIDFKMKFEAKSARETTKEHYAKRGMSWHGILFQYFEKVEVEDVVGGKQVTRQEVVKKNVYLDQILAHGNDQSVSSVVAFLEAGLKWLDKNLPFIDEIVLQSDNAECYNSNELRIFICLVNTYSRIKIIRYIFTETQDGKGECACPAVLLFLDICCRLLNFCAVCPVFCIPQVFSMLTSQEPWLTSCDSRSLLDAITSAPS